MLSLNELSAGIANFGIQFNYSTISVAMLYISNIYGSTPSWASSATSSSVFAGSIIGMLVMGFLGDAIGRKRAMLITLSVAAGGALLSAFASFGDEDITFGLITFWRIIMGIGVGGLYPLSSVFAYETENLKHETTDDILFKSDIASANLEQKGSVRAASAMFWQIPGQIFVYLAGILLLFTDWNYRVQWRLLVASGSIPFFIVVLLIRRIGLHENDYIDIPSSNEDISLTSQAISTFDELCDACKEAKIRNNIIGASVAWFLFDVYVYGVMIYSPLILDMIFADNSISSNCWQNIVSIIATLPAAFLSIYALDHISARTLQLTGFSVVAISFLLFGFLWEILTSHPTYLFILFCYIKFAMALFVPSTTFAIPNLLFPQHIRASCSGIAAASGKLGAFVGAFVFPVVYDAFGFKIEMICCSVVALLALVITFLYIPVQPTEAEAQEQTMITSMYDDEDVETKELLKKL